MVENTGITKMGLSNIESKEYYEYEDALEQAHKKIGELTLANSRKNTKLIIMTIAFLIINPLIIIGIIEYNNNKSNVTRINKDYRELYRSVKRENVLLRNNAIEAEQMRLVYYDSLERESFAEVVNNLPEAKKAEWYAFVKWVKNNPDIKFNDDKPILPDGANANNDL
jgi:hypothetical protein